MDSLDCHLGIVSLYHHADRYFRRTLGNGNHVDTSPAQSAEHAPGNAWRVDHARAYHSDNGNIPSRPYAVDIAVGQLPRESLFQLGDHLSGGLGRHREAN